MPGIHFGHHPDARQAQSNSHALPGDDNELCQAYRDLEHLPDVAAWRFVVEEMANVERLEWVRYEMETRGVANTVPDLNDEIDPLYEKVCDHLVVLLRRMNGDNACIEPYGEHCAPIDPGEHRDKMPAGMLYAHTA